MLTIFTIPKPFVKNNAITQTNAINSWLCLDKNIEILLFGDEQGIQEIALRDPRIRHISSIKKNQQGTPFLSDVFKKAQALAKHNLLCYASSDIILLPSLIPILKKLPENKHITVLARRTDIDIDKPIDFSNNWEAKLVDKAKSHGKLHGFSALDLIIFPKNLPMNMPDFLVGRPGWDNALIYQLIRQRITIIDASPLVTAIHQNHNYSHHAEGKKGVWQGNEAWHNFRLAGGLSQMANIKNARYLLTENGLVKPPFIRLLYSSVSLFYPIRKLLGIKRWVNAKRKL
jgi:hypothetical protein